MAADTTLKTVLADIQDDPTPKNYMTNKQFSPAFRIILASYTIPTGDLLEAGDVIRIVKLPKGAKVLSEFSKVTADTGTATALPVNIGDYSVGTNNALGTVQDADRYATLIDLENSGAPVSFDAYPNYELANDSWITATVGTGVNTPVAGKVIKFIIAVNFPN